MNESEDLARRIEAADAIIDNPEVPARLRQMATFVKKRVEFYRDHPDRRDEFHDGKRYAPTWMRDHKAIRELVESGAFVEDPATGHVTLRWDLISDERREVAVSMANEVVAMYRGRTAGGRPKK